MRDRMATAFNAGSLQWSDRGERPVDRIAALARTDRLASLLWRAKYGSDRHAMKAAALLLSQRVHALAEKRRWQASSPDIIDRMCQQCVVEWVNDTCPDCKGRGRVAVVRQTKFAVPRECPACNGTGKLRIVKARRAAAIGISAVAYAKTWDRRFAQVMDLISGLDLDADRVLHRQL